MEAQPNPQELLAVTAADPLTRQRGLLIGVTFGALFALALVTNLRGRVYLGDDLAHGKPWRTSSSIATCSPSIHSCAAADTDIFFHTADEEEPWLEIDLEKPTAFSSLTVTNRSDCCSDRAWPLVVEVGDDAKTWREVARRDELFLHWAPSFPAVTARYVRLRVAKKTQFHLEAVEVRK